MKIQPFKLERYFAKYEFKTPHLLTCSDCEAFKIDELLKFDENESINLHNLSLGYIESQGTQELREQISLLYNDIHPNQILCLSGAQEGILIFMNTILTPRDHIIVQSPAYQSLYEIAKSIGCRVSKWELIDNNEWELDIEKLSELLTPNTKALIINFPHNPTGAMITPEKLLKIIDFAKKHDLYIFSDEVYRFLEFDETKRLPAIVDLYYKGISLGVMSKSFGLAGLRIGWIVSRDDSLKEKMKIFKDYTTICNSAPSEWFATLALKHKEKIIKRNLDVINKNLILLDHFFEKYCTLFEWNKPRAGSIGLVKIKFEQTADDFCLDVVETAGVLLLPSNLFDFGNNYFRIGFGRKSMPEALVKFEDYLQNRFYNN